eukprot:TRINITY_DN338_c0_g2_i1.p2 TRINITY_DN338_c0_g2~~TRINITY_DN338_c0_g2_i1.p2  ORF type:complete len:122 (-),score=14.43 TRINITY_DN338_c0_g2_i1:341-706(-)
MCILAGGSQLVSSAILGHDGSVWAQSAAFPNITTEQINNIMAGFDDAGILAQKGLKLGDDKFMVIQGEPGIALRGKKGSGGCCIRKTTSALIVGIYDKPTQPGECNMVVENMGDYLSGLGY